MFLFFEASNEKQQDGVKKNKQVLNVKLGRCEELNQPNGKNELKNIRIMDKGKKWNEKQMLHGTAMKGLHKWRKEFEAIIQLTHHRASPVYIGPIFLCTYS